MISAIVSVPSSLIAMMRGTAAGTAEGRDETWIVVLAAGTIGYTIGWIEDIRDFTTETTEGLTSVK